MNKEAKAHEAREKWFSSACDSGQHYQCAGMAWDMVNDTKTKCGCSCGCPNPPKNRYARD